MVTDTQKQPVAGVVVTDGVNFTQTDDKGRYQLVSDPAQSKFVYLSVPADYKTNVENALPVGYYAGLMQKSKRIVVIQLGEERTAGSGFYLYSYL